MVEEMKSGAPSRLQFTYQGEQVALGLRYDPHEFGRHVGRIGLNPLKRAMGRGLEC